MRVSEGVGGGGRDTYLVLLHMEGHSQGQEGGPSIHLLRVLLPFVLEICVLAADHFGGIVGVRSQ